MVNWITILMAGAGGAVAQLDPSQSFGAPMFIMIVKGFIGAAVGAYFGNHVSEKHANIGNSKEKG